jgi:hypothetical protein
LAAKKVKSWEEIRSETPLNERRVAAYERLMDAEELIAHARYERGVSDETILDALEASEPEGAHFEHEDELYLTVLGRYVATLGGVLELRAVFPEGTVVVLSEPEGQSGLER